VLDDEDSYRDPYHEEWGVHLNLDPETRVWELTARGSAAMLLFIFMDVSQMSLVNKLIEEARFDSAIKGYDLDGE
jgi:hypothetical protein|tara:strand:- start:5359 stop:5583 length:225 start_codon:yes stop_codon:yes gene_type:complete